MDAIDAISPCQHLNPKNIIFKMFLAFQIFGLPRLICFVFMQIVIFKIQLHHILTLKSFIRYKGFPSLYTQ